MRKLRAGLAIVLLALALSLGACGTDERAVVVRVGGHAITKATVDRWTRAVRMHGAFSGFRAVLRRGTARQRALSLLISSYWLIGEAERQGLAVPAEAVKSALSERERGEGEEAFRKSLARTGQTPGGLEFELRAELALEAIRQSIAARAEQVTPAEAARYYRKNLALFSTPPTWVVDIVERIPSRAAAVALVKRVGAGRRFTAVAVRKKLPRDPGELLGDESKKNVDKAIYASRPGVISEPMRLWGAWTVFVVRRIIPARATPLAQARSSVLTSMTTRRAREIESAFSRGYRARWSRRTACRDGYVAPGCAQYRGLLGAYEDPFTSTS